MLNSQEVDPSEAQAVYARYLNTLRNAGIPDSAILYYGPPQDKSELYLQLTDTLAIEALLNPDGGARLRQISDGDIIIERFLHNQEIDFTYGRVQNRANYRLTGELDSSGIVCMQKLRIENLELEFGEGSIRMVRNPESLEDPLFRPIIIKFTKDENSNWQVNQLKIDMGRISGNVSHNPNENDELIINPKTGECEYYFNNGPWTRTLPVNLGNWFRIDRTQTYPKKSRNHVEENKVYPYVFIDPIISEGRITQIHFAFTRTDNPPQNPDTAIFSIPSIPDDFEAPSLMIPKFEDIKLILDKNHLERIDALANAMVGTFLLPSPPLS